MRTQDVFPSGKLRETLCVSYSSPPRGKPQKNHAKNAFPCGKAFFLSL